MHLYCAQRVDIEANIYIYVCVCVCVCLRQIEVSYLHINDESIAPIYKSTVQYSNVQW
jgi:hypothetical protein